MELVNKLNEQIDEQNKRNKKRDLQIDEELKKRDPFIYD